MLTITAGGFAFIARLEEEDAPETVAAFRRLLPLESRIIHVRWSGEAGLDPVRRPRPRARPRERDVLPAPRRDRPLPRRRLRDGDPARLRLRQLRLEGRPAGGQPLRDDRGGQREPAPARRRSSSGRGRRRSRSPRHRDAAPGFEARRRRQTKSSCDRLRKGADRLAAAQQLGDGRAPLVAVVLGELVHVHLDEAVGDGLVDAAPELERVLERLVAVLEPAADRLGRARRRGRRGARRRGARR